MIPCRFYNEQKSWVAEFVTLCMAKIDAATKEGRRAVLCLSGGTTPKPLYEALCQALCDRVETGGQSVTAFVGDERWEPENPDLQNGPTIRTAFRDALDSGALELVEWNLFVTPEQACGEMQKALARHLGQGLSFDLACLGLGKDGHTAGLFEPTGILSDASEYRAPLPPYRRLSLSAELLSRSKASCFALELPGKEDAVARLSRLDPSISASRACSAGACLHILLRGA